MSDIIFSRRALVLNIHISLEYIYIHICFTDLVSGLYVYHYYYYYY